ncbi:MAG: hypothetical protein AAGC63_07450 [Propionicimonas sp.]|nr:hypothetical protein [Propionicimonas sp.]
MTVRTLPATPRGGLSLVHQPTTRNPALATTARPTPATVLSRRLAAWWRQLSGPDLGWAQERLITEGHLYTDAYTWTLRSTR